MDGQGIDLLAAPKRLERLSVVYGSETKAVERLINVAGDALTKEGGS